MAPVMGEKIKELMMTYVKYPPRKLQSDGYTGPITITDYQKFQWLHEQLAKDGFNLSIPGDNRVREHKSLMFNSRVGDDAAMGCTSKINQTDVYRIGPFAS